MVSMDWVLHPAVVFGLAGACLALLLLIVFFLLRMRRMQRGLLRMAEELDLRKEVVARSEVETPRVPKASELERVVSSGFDGVLKAEELRDRLERHVPSEDSLDRYMHVQSLADKGCGAEEIARILHISPEEVSQVLALSRIRNRTP